MSSNKKTAADLEYNEKIKTKLVAWQKAYEAAHHGSLNYSKIADTMVERFGIRTSAQKVAAMFNTRSPREVKLQELAALSAIFRFPVEDICEFENTPALSDIDPTGLIRRKQFSASPARPLDNEYYSGTYYCYYFRPKQKKDQLYPLQTAPLEEAEMIIGIEAGHTTVTLREMKTSKTFDGKPTPGFRMTGNLYVYPNTNICYAFTADDTGRRAMALMFSFLNISSDVRYYMTVGMMPFSVNQVHEPIFQKMAVFRVRQDLKQTDISDTIRGILALNTTPIVLDEETIGELIAEDEKWKKVLSPEKALRNCYAFSEGSILSGLFFVQDDEKMQMLLDLRRRSLYAAHEVVSETDAFTDYIKKYQEKQKSAVNNQQE